MNSKKIKVRFCPSCKSFDVRYTFGIKNLFGIMPKQVCLKCRYSAEVFPILEVDSKSLKKLNEKEKDDGKKQGR